MDGCSTPFLFPFSPRPPISGVCLPDCLSASVNTHSLQQDALLVEDSVISPVGQSCQFVSRSRSRRHGHGHDSGRVSTPTRWFVRLLVSRLFVRVLCLTTNLHQRLLSNNETTSSSSVSIHSQPPTSQPLQAACISSPPLFFVIGGICVSSFSWETCMFQRTVHPVLTFSLHSIHPPSPASPL